MNITITGSLEEIIAFAKTIERGYHANEDMRLAESRNSLDAECLRLYNEKQAIKAIKLYREITGSTLKDAKDYVEALAGKQHLASL
jgi:ribosomal protein L7/L12